MAEKQRVIAYIDRFNLYFGLRESGLRRCYWLNLRAFAESLLRSGQVLVRRAQIDHNGLASKIATVAQLAEQRFCKPQVNGSSPFGGYDACEPEPLARGSMRFVLFLELLSPVAAEIGSSASPCSAHRRDETRVVVPLPPRLRRLA